MPFEAGDDVLNGSKANLALFPVAQKAIDRSESWPA